MSFSHTRSLVFSDITTTAVWVTIMIHPQGYMAARQLGNGNVAANFQVLIFLIYVPVLQVSSLKD